MKITQVPAKKRPSFSLEVYPPKTAEGTAKLFQALEELVKLEPDFISVTYGAGGTTSKSTLEIAERIQHEFDISCVHHLTLVNQTVEQLASHIGRISEKGLKNILALRGDPPEDGGRWFEKIEGGLEYCYELIDLIKDTCDGCFSIGVAGFPECHADCPSESLDTEYLWLKISHGAQFVITQLFFSNESYGTYLKRTSERGINVPIIPGVLPITDYQRLLSFADSCGAYICDEVHRIFKPIADDVLETAKQGILYSISQCGDLLKRGAPGIHFYTLNRVEPVRTIWENVMKTASTA
jgi:methylenetetrahydrofolate reductase (NADPH)